MDDGKEIYVLNGKTLCFDPEKHAYSVDGIIIPSVTDIVHPFSESEYSDINPMILQQAAVKGAEVHEACELIDYGMDEIDISPEWIGYIKAYFEFLHDYIPVWEAIECPLFNEKGGFAGRLDRAGIINGQNAIVDIKTVLSVSKVMMASYCAQTYAYGETYYGSESYKRYILLLKKDGTYVLRSCEEYEKSTDIVAKKFLKRVYG